MVPSSPDSSSSATTPPCAQGSLRSIHVLPFADAEFDSGWRRAVHRDCRVQRFFRTQVHLQHRGRRTSGSRQSRGGHDRAGDRPQPAAAATPGSLTTTHPRSASAARTTWAFFPSSTTATSASARPGSWANVRRAASSPVTRSPSTRAIFARTCALRKLGTAIAARMPMMATTIRSSIRVKDVLSGLNIIPLSVLPKRYLHMCLIAEV